MVWIDRGRADGLLRQTTFSVYDHNESGISSTKPKGRIEVLTVGENQSEARILQDSPANPIIGGDIIDTPAWSPGQRIHFALAMKMDINKDRVDDALPVHAVLGSDLGFPPHPSMARRTSARLPPDVHRSYRLAWLVGSSRKLQSSHSPNGPTISSS